MACAEFEQLLLEYPELENGARARVDAHVAQCSGCREFLDALLVVDSQLTAEFAGQEVSASFAPAVHQRVQSAAPLARPSLVPELLDFAGWGAIAALAGLLAWWLVPLVPVPHWELSLDASFAAAGAFLLAALLVGIRSFADLKD